MKVNEINLGADAVNVVNRDVALTRDTMIVRIDCYYNNLQWEMETKIEIWKIDTEDPQEEGIALLHTMTHRNAPLSRLLRFNTYQNLCINDRFTVISDDLAHSLLLVKVFGRNAGTPLVCQLEIENKTLRAMAMQGGEGEHLALALISVNADNVSELMVKVYSASQGHLIVQKEIGTFPRSSAPFFMKWFGDHLTVCVQQVNSVSVFSWQPGLVSFLKSPFGVPVVRRSSRGNRGVSMWEAKCLHVDFQGITTVVRKIDNFYYGFEKVFCKTWKSAS